MHIYLAILLFQILLTFLVPLTLLILIKYGYEKSKKYLK